MEQPLLTKFYIPPTRSKIVSRPRLIEKINHGLEAKLTLISAPAGFGKTYLASEWVENFCDSQAEFGDSKTEIVWLTVDKADEAPARFLTYFIAALRQADSLGANFGQGALSMLASPQAPPIEGALIALINEFSSVQSNLIMVLDDFHQIESEEVNDALGFLLDKQPPQLHLIILSREDLKLPLARLRAQDQLNEIRAADLRFTASEAVDFLNNLMGLALSTEDIAALQSRTEGWITGLQMAAAYMQGHKDPAGLIKKFTGSHRLVLDYLLEEVLDKQSPEVQDFLLRTAVLDRLTAPLCNALTGRQDGQQILDEMDQANLFIVPLDDARGWYRYHHLFKDLLCQRLNHLQPGTAAALNHTASEWHQANGFMSDAIEHALRAGDHQRMVELIESSIEAIWHRGEHMKLGRWLKSLPQMLLETNSQLCILYAWNLFVRGYHTPADQYLQMGERALVSASSGSLGRKKMETALPGDDPSRELRGKLYSIRALMAAYKGEVKSIIMYANQALDHLPKQDFIWRLSSIIALGDAYFFDGDPKEAYKARLEAQELSNVSGNAYLSVLTAQRLALTLFQQGHLKQVVDICQRYYQLACENGIAQSDIAGWLLAIWGEALAEVNQLDEAIDKVSKGAELTTLGGDVVLIAWTHLCLVRVSFTRGEVHNAENILQKIENLSMETNFPPWITSHISYLKIRLLLANDKLEAAAAWAETRGLDVSQVPPPLREIEYMGLVRLLIAQGELEETHKLLGYLIEITEGKGHILRLIELLVIKSLVYDARGEKDQAIRILEQAISKAEPGGFIRVFIDEGPPMARLLYEAYNRGISQEYVSTVLSAFLIPEIQHPVFKRWIHLGEELITPLTEREIEILQLIAEGLANKEIASRLHLSLSTVKVHNMHIFEKLEASNRREAVIRAKVLGILS